MTLFTKLRKLLRDDSGVTAALVAVSLTATVGMSAAAIDLGVLYSARSELQNAADSAALAAATTMFSVDSEHNVTVQTSTALSTADQFSRANKALGKALPLKSPPGDDFTIGFWDTDAGAFDPYRTGMGLTNPDDINAVQVRVRRDDQANTPVGTYFANIVGVPQVGMSAVSTAFRSYASSSPSGGTTLPIAVLDTAITSGGQPNCGEYLTFHSQNEQNAEWTTFFTWPSNDQNVDNYICGCLPSPELEVGDTIYVTNGNLSTNTWNDLRDNFNHNKGSDGTWTVTLPVVSAGGSSTSVTVAGFTTFVITEVRGSPNKDLTGYLQCQTVLPGSTTGDGGNYGTRAATAKLIR